MVTYSPKIFFLRHNLLMSPKRFTLRIIFEKLRKRKPARSTFIWIYKKCIYPHYLHDAVPNILSKKFKIRGWRDVPVFSSQALTTHSLHLVTWVTSKSNLNSIWKIAIFDFRFLVNKKKTNKNNWKIKKPRTKKIWPWRSIFFF